MGYINSILLPNENEYPIPIDTCGNLRLVKNQQLGEPIYHYNIRNEIREILLDMIKGNDIFTTTLTINKKVLEDSELLDIIKEKIKKNNSHINIRILDENYSLSKEDYQKLSFAKNIIVDHKNDDVTANNIIIQNNVFKYDEQGLFQPVIERRVNFEDLKSCTSFHINHELSDDEFEYLANNINNCPNENIRIELDYRYVKDDNGQDIDKSEYYYEFLSKLRRHTHKKLNIQLIGYLLEDKPEMFDKIYNEFEQNEIFEIDVVYSTCHDIVKKYTKEPYTEGRVYRSPVEGSGKTSIKNYAKITRKLCEFQEEVTKLKLSPLETAIYAKYKMDKDLIYDPDYLDPNKNDDENTSLSFVFNGNKAICVGFADLFSAYLRKCKIPMLSYGTTGHRRNVGRIKDEKYNLDQVCICDPTWDNPSQVYDLKARNYFMIDPREIMKHIDGDGNHELCTPADCLVLSKEEYKKLPSGTHDPYELFYNLSSNPKNILEVLMIQMGLLDTNILYNLDSPEKADEYIYNTIYQLNKNRQTTGIPLDVLDQAYENTFRKIGLTQDEINDYFEKLRSTDFIRDKNSEQEIMIYNEKTGENIPVQVLESGKEYTYKPTANNLIDSEPKPEPKPIDKPTPTPKNSVEVIVDERKKIYIPSEIYTQMFKKNSESKEIDGFAEITVEELSAVLSSYEITWFTKYHDDIQEVDSSIIVNKNVDAETYVRAMKAIIEIQMQNPAKRKSK